MTGVTQAQIDAVQATLITNGGAAAYLIGGLSARLTANDNYECGMELREAA